MLFLAWGKSRQLMRPNDRGNGSERPDDTGDEAQRRSSWRKLRAEDARLRAFLSRYIIPLERAKFGKNALTRKRLDRFCSYFGFEVHLRSFKCWYHGFWQKLYGNFGLFSQTLVLDFFLPELLWLRCGS